MGNGIVLIIYGLIFIIYPKTQIYKEYMEKHNFTDRVEFQNDIGNIVGSIILIIGAISFIVDLISKF